MVVRIGRHAPTELFVRLRSRTGVFVTAWNPLSRRMPDGWNHRMQQRLQAYLPPIHVAGDPALVPSSWPGLCRPSTSVPDARDKDVAGGAKAGHDDGDDGAGGSVASRLGLRHRVVLPAEGSLHRWREAHLLVAGDPRPVLRLARRFRQRGVVVVKRGRAARLVLLGYEARVDAVDLVDRVRLGSQTWATGQ